jgi:polyisoprenyl-phosphate glycosyltransferase
MSNTKQVDLSVIIPIYNEQGNIPELYKRLSEVAQKITNNYEFIFVNDGSKDASLISLIELSKQDSHVFYINFSRNFGHQIAVTAGLDFSSGKAVVIIDADLQDPPEVILDLYKNIRKDLK